MTQQSRGSSDGSGDRISRRKFVTGGLLLVGGSSLIANAKTSASFHDTESAGGTVQINGDPTLNYQITDESENNKAQYTVAYQVEWVTNFDRIEIQIDNNPDGQYSPDSDEAVKFTEYSEEGAVSHSFGGNHAGETFEFVFEVYEQDSQSPIITKITTDVADGEGTDDGDFGDVNSPDLKRISVFDNFQNNKANYTVEYEASDTNFYDALITFDNKTQTNWGDATRTSTDKPIGSVSYSKGGTGGDLYDITVELRKANGITVATQTIKEEKVDGDDTEWIA